MRNLPNRANSKTLFGLDYLLSLLMAAGIVTSTTTIPEINPCSCVETARISLPYIKGNAEDIEPNTDNFEIGGGILIDYGTSTEEKHVAVGVEETATRYVLFNGNLKHCQLSMSYIKKNDPRIRGFLRKEFTKGYIALSGP